MLKAVFLDYTGTIIEEGGPEGLRFLKRCCDNSDMESMEGMLKYWWKLVKEFEANSYQDTYLTEDEIVDQALAVCERELHLQENMQELHQLCRGFWVHAPAFPDAKPFFEKCPLPIYVITNNGVEYVEKGLEEKGLKPARIVCGDMVRAYKPHRELFDKALEISGCGPNEVIHIGDSVGSDVKGAQAAGITPVLLDRTGKQSIEGVKTIASLTEALEFLGV